MNTTVLTYEFNGQALEFNLHQGDVMVNATQMAKLFDKQVNHFLETQQTKSFLEACFSSRNNGNSNIETQEDLYTTHKKYGTFMHRILALKFAAWLSPAFELWIFRTIDEILFGNMRLVEQSLQESAARKNKIQAIHQSLSDNPMFLELESLRLQERQAAYSRSNFAKAQIKSMRQTALPFD